jgi:hypothetical protein
MFQNPDLRGRRSGEAGGSVRHRSKKSMKKVMQQVGVEPGNSALYHQHRFTSVCNTVYYHIQIWMILFSAVWFRFAFLQMAAPLFRTCKWYERKTDEKENVAQHLSLQDENFIRTLTYVMLTSWRPDISEIKRNTDCVVAFGQAVVFLVLTLCH